jgi:hypothetical protein
MIVSHHARPVLNEQIRFAESNLIVTLFGLPVGYAPSSLVRGRLGHVPRRFGGFVHIASPATFAPCMEYPFEFLPLLPSPSFFERPRVFLHGGFA